MARTPGQLDIFAQAGPATARSLDGLTWPDPKRFPLNASRNRVRDQVIEDLKSADSPLIVAGYAAIDHLVNFLGELPRGHGKVRLLLGAEPSAGKAERYAVSRQAFPREVADYWLREGISPRLSGRLLEAVEKLRSGTAEARYLGDGFTRLHAKIYVGDQGVTVGSSNFTEPGLVRQLEANARFDRDSDPQRYAETRQIAENYWSAGAPYTEELIALLQSLLQWVTWQEALARAAAELLEGQWAADYAEASHMPGDRPLWPSQQQGIAQALWILESVGSVLVSDATGSGKTRMGAHLIRALKQRNARAGRIRGGRTVLVCPPAVAKNWERESTLAESSYVVRSHGRLSYSASSDHGDIVDAIRRAHIVAVDEAHNFLNPASRRSRALLGNMADHTILFTATPINRGTVDLLRLADMLGADNLAESTLKAFERLLRRPNVGRSLSQHEQELIRAELARFTVRRTKSMLNEMVDRAPGLYRDLHDKPCRYPRHDAKTYSLHESTTDRELAQEIRDAADQLIGVALMAKPIEMPEVLRREGWDEERYLDSRLRGVARLSAYLVMATLRSSKWALLEHLLGTENALREAGLDANLKRQTTGDVLGRLRARSGRPPGSLLAVAVPSWVTDSASHRAACEHDQRLYERILTLARKLSRNREVARASLIRKLASRHSMIVAFDSRPISLAGLRGSLMELQSDLEPVLATGEQKKSRREVSERMKRGAGKGRMIALCSDAMSEGVNLQEASVVVHLDMPSVVRVAEQRVGRVDRMDSPHERVEVYWPDDASEFALRSDERFLERYEAVETLLGSNLPLPEQLIAGRAEAVTPASLIAEAEGAAARPWDEIRDAFSPVRELVTGDEALVSPAVYEEYRDVAERVAARVCRVDSPERWALLCFSGSSVGAPRWVFCRESEHEMELELSAICRALRRRLGPDVRNLGPGRPAMNWLEQVIERVHKAERRLLPRRKQRAVDELTIILQRYRQDAAIASDHDDEERLRSIVSVLEAPDPDVWLNWDEIAERWLELIRPLWYTRLTAPRRSRPLLLKDIRRDLMGEHRLPLPAIYDAFLSLPTLDPVDQRLAACILGVGEESE